VLKRFFSCPNVYNLQHRRLQDYSKTSSLLICP
jgi:hypothetical protein